MLPSRKISDAGADIRDDGSKRTGWEWLRFPSVELDHVATATESDIAADDLLAQELSEDAAYAPYLERQDAELRDLRASENVRLPTDFPYDNVPGLSNEMVEKLSAARPDTLASAARVRG